MLRRYRKTYKKLDYTPTFPHNTEANAIKAGNSAFSLGVSFYNNPYNKDAPAKSAWIRGWKRAEKRFFDNIKVSMQIQESIGFEEN